MGAVSEAEHLALGRLVADKVLHPTHAQKRAAITRLEHEARVGGTIGHPNICAVYDMGRLDDGSPYLVITRSSAAIDSAPREPSSSSTITWPSTKLA